MFLKITTKKYGGRTYRHASLVETIRVEGKVVQKHIQNLGALNTEEDEKKAKQIIKDIRIGKKIVLLDEVNELCLEYGVRIVVGHLWHELGLPQFFNDLKAKYDLSQILYMLAAHRLHNYGSRNISELEGYHRIPVSYFSHTKCGKISTEKLNLSFQSIRPQGDYILGNSL